MAAHLYKVVSATLYETELNVVRPSVFRMSDTALLVDVGAAMMPPSLTSLISDPEVLCFGNTSEL